jgi:hypothetical protein
MYGWAALEPDPNRVVAPAAGAPAKAAVTAATVPVISRLVHLERLAAPPLASARLIVLTERSFPLDIPLSLLGLLILWRKLAGRV